MVVCGHVLNEGTGLLISEGDNGNQVYQMLANYQTGVIGSENGGNGYLRIIDIDPVREMMSIRTYSPFLNEFKTEKDQQFSFEGIKLIKSDLSQVNAQTEKKLDAFVSGNILYVWPDADQNVSVNMLDPVGKIIYSKKILGNRIELPEKKGCYIVQVSDGEEKLVKKVILQ